MRSYIISALGTLIATLVFLPLSAAQSFRNRVLNSRLVKSTGLWKYFSKRDGSYLTELEALHKQHGDIVQVGPREYSVVDPIELQILERRKALAKQPTLFNHLFKDLHHKWFSILDKALSMANIFRYEANIDDCNANLYHYLYLAADSEEVVDMSDLICRYAYDMLFSTTVGLPPGFLKDGPRSTTKLQDASNAWKSNAILQGSYFRFFPNMSGLRKKIKHVLDDIPDVESECILRQMQRIVGENENISSKDTVEICMVLLLSGADPTIAHILAALYFAYQTSDLVEALREEIRDANLDQTPKIKDLIHKKPQMPLLHAVLQESLRLIRSQIAGSSYIVPKDGVMIADRHINEGCTICCEPSVAHVDSKIFGTNAEEFHPPRWLQDRATSRRLRNHMIAFGAGTQTCPGENLHHSIVAKAFTAIIAHFDIDIDMASVGTQNSSMALTFNDVKERFHAKISLPTFVRPIFNTPASPLRATAPAFAPETTTAPEFPPGLTPKKFAFANAYNEQASCGVPFYAQAPEFVPKIATGNNVESKSPSLSIATTANATTDISSILSTTSLTWKDEQTLEDIIGHNDTNKLLNRFDPNAKHLSRGMLKTCAVSSSYDRKLLHEVIERVWSGRLTHETDRQDDCMYIWLPGTRVPKWLHRLHLSRKSKNTANQAVEQSPADPVSQKATAPAVREARPEAAVWNSFAKTENIRYAKAAAMSGPEYAAAEAKKYTENGITQPAPGRQHNFHETFKQTGTLATNDKLSVSDNVVYDEHLQGRYSGACAGTVTAPAEPRKAVLPPHLRAKALTAQKVKVRAGDSESDSEDGVWVAARLPSPCSSD